MADWYINSAVGNDGNAGTAPGSGNAWATIGFACEKVADDTILPGDTIHVEAIAGNAASYPTSGLDYNQVLCTPPFNSAPDGEFVKWVGRNGVPTVGVSEGCLLSSKQQSFEGIYFVATGNTYASYGILYIDSDSLITDCTINTNAQAGQVGINAVGNGVVIRNAEVYGGSGASASSGAYGIQCAGAVTVVNCKIRGNGDHGIAITGSPTGPINILSNRVYGNLGDGINVAYCRRDFPQVICGNTIHANSGNGIGIPYGIAIGGVLAWNNSITNHTGSGKYGLKPVSTGASFEPWGGLYNDGIRRFCDYNNVYNNSTNYNDMTAGPHDLSVDPGYASAGTGDFTPGNSAMQAGYPSGWIGAVQPSGGSGGPTYFSF